MSSIFKNRSSFSPFLWIAILLFFGHCNNVPETSKLRDFYESQLNPAKKATKISFPQKDSAEMIFYLSKRYSAVAFRKQKAQELVEWESELDKEFGIPFQYTYHHKYFNIAYQCSDQKMNYLKYVLEKFFDKIYPLYFKNEPSYPFQIVYFENKKIFTKHTDSKSFGFYKPSKKTLYTYTDSGEGTLWHEMIHAFVDAHTDVGVHQWFGEGFASFYEMGAIQNDHFYEGYVNWRHPQLQTAIRRDQFLPLAKFLKEKEMSEDIGYAKARFFFCYLWMHRQMVPFVKAYLYELLPKYQGAELNKKVLEKIENLLGKNIQQIEQEYKAKALELRQSEKLKVLR